ncbi:unnamed protein product, partial [Didymodactylos carnosus]
EETKQFLEDHTSSMKKDISDADQDMLTVYVKYWTEYSNGAQYLNLLYGYLNTQFVKKRQVNDHDQLLDCNLESNEQPLFEIGEMALDCWTKIIIEP